MQARLIVVRGVADPPSFEFGNSQCVTLGRSTESTIVLQDAHASRQHAQVYFDAGHWYLRDCGGRNGTRVNGTRIDQPVQLSDGQEIAIANTAVRFNLLFAK